MPLWVRDWAAGPPLLISNSLFTVTVTEGLLDSGALIFCRVFRSSGPAGGWRHQPQISQLTVPSTPHSQLSSKAALESSFLGLKEYPADRCARPGRRRSQAAGAGPLGLSESTGTAGDSGRARRAAVPVCDRQPPAETWLSPRRQATVTPGTRSRKLRYHRVRNCQFKFSTPSHWQPGCPGHSLATVPVTQA